MKYSSLLGELQQNAYFEIAGIDVTSLKVKKIALSNSSMMYSFILEYLKDNSDKPFDLFSLQDISNALDSFTNIPKVKQNVLNSFSALKNKNGYLTIEKEGDKEFFFLVGSKLYHLRLVSGQSFSVSNSIEIIFNSINSYKDLMVEPRYAANNIFSNKSDGSKLFNMISAIIKKEIKTWKNEIFYFNSKMEDDEISKINSLEKIIKEINGALFYASDEDESLSDRENYLNKVRSLIVKDVAPFKSTLMKIKNLFISEISDDTKKTGEAIIDYLLFNKRAPKLSGSSFRINNSSVLRSKNQEVEDIIEGMVGRNRIYRIVIKQMFGSKVTIANKGGKIFFSLNKEKVNDLR